MALTTDANLAHTGGDVGGIRLQVSEIPFAGSALAFAQDGYAELVDATSKGQPFAGFALQRIESRDHPSSGAADGDVTAQAKRGLFLARLAISGVALDDVAHGRAVYAQDDGTFSFDPAGTLVGRVWALEATGIAIVVCATAGHHGALGLRCSSVKTLAATGTEALTTADLGKLILVANTAGKQIDLPAAADCTGRGFTIKKTGGGAFALTLDGSGAETIDGAATFAAVDANQDSVEIISDGTGWHVIGGRIV